MTCKQAALFGLGVIVCWASSSGAQQHSEAPGIGSEPAGAAQRKSRRLLAGEHNNLDLASPPETSSLQRAQRCYATNHPERAVVCACQRNGIRVRARLHSAHCVLQTRAQPQCKLLKRLGLCTALAFHCRLNSYWSQRCQDIQLAHLQSSGLPAELSPASRPKMLPTASSLTDSPASRISSFTYLQATATYLWHIATFQAAVSAQQDEGACVRASMSLGVKTMRVTAGLGWSENVASFSSCSTTTEPDTSSLLGYTNASMHRKHSSRVPIQLLTALGGRILQLCELCCAGACSIEN